jgi:hypothetical protein
MVHCLCAELRPSWACSFGLNSAAGMVCTRVNGDQCVRPGHMLQFLAGVYPAVTASCAVLCCAVQAAFRRISNDVFGHLLDLDLNFHVHRKTGQIMRILDRGTTSIQVSHTTPLQTLRTHCTQNERHLHRQAS